MLPPWGSGSCPHHSPSSQVSKVATCLLFHSFKLKTSPLRQYFQPTSQSHALSMFLIKSIPDEDSTINQWRKSQPCYFIWNGYRLWIPIQVKWSKPQWWMRPCTQWMATAYLSDLHTSFVFVCALCNKYVITFSSFPSFSSTSASIQICTLQLST